MPNITVVENASVRFCFFFVYYSFYILVLLFRPVCFCKN